MIFIFYPSMIVAPCGLSSIFLSNFAFIYGANCVNHPKMLFYFSIIS